MRPALVVIGASTAIGLAAAAWLAARRGRLLRPSTRQVISLMGLGRFFRGLGGLHFYIYGRWPVAYVRFARTCLVRLFGRRLKRWAADHYHGKVLHHQQARALVTINREIVCEDLKRVIPYRTARKLILRQPLEIVAFPCPCRLSRPVHCQPVDVCLIVGRPFTQFMLEHHSGRCRQITQAEALEIIDAEHRRGHIHSAWFKDVCLERFYVICNCCKCCCGGIEAMVRYGFPMLASSGYVAEVDWQQCHGCGQCVELCPFEAIGLHQVAQVRWEACMGCGLCAQRCPAGAISLRQDASKGEPLDVTVL